MADPISFLANTLSFVAAVALLIYLIISRNYEDKKFSRSMSVFLFAVFILVLNLAVKVIVGLRENFRLLVLPVETIPVIEEIAVIALMPLFGICILVSALLFREDLA